MENPEIIMEELEDGEVSSDCSDDYTPLERPASYSKVSQPPPVIQDSESEEEEHSSDVDSDDSLNMQNSRIKRPKIKLKPKPRHVSDKKKKFDIWTTKVQEDVLTETLISCDVTQKDRSRDVESYDYTLSYSHRLNGNSNKRTREDRKNVHCRLGRRNNPARENEKSAGRVILDLNTTIENTEEEIAKDIANKLCEQKEDLIVKSLKAVGKSKCLEIFRKTQEIEADGGLSVMNYTRRRTPGGVFLHLLKIDDSIEQSKKSEIFNEDRKRDARERKRKQALKWKEQTDKERAKLLPELLTKAELLIQNRHLKEVSEADVVNPPPTPETDGHENSCDGIDSLLSNNQVKSDHKVSSDRGLVKYEDDILDIGCSNMDLF